MRNTHGRTRNMSRTTEKKLKMRKTHCRTWNMEKKPENGEHETQTLFDLEYGEKNLKMQKMRNAPGVWQEN